MTKELEQRLLLLEKELSDKINPSRKKRRILIIVAVAIVILTSLGLTWYKYDRQADPFPREIKTVNFSLPYPDDLPENFTLDTESFEKTQDIITYTVTYDSDKKLAFTIQPRPDDFDFESFQSKGRRLDSSLGEAYAGTIEDKQTVVSLVTDDSWLLIGVPEAIKTTTLQTILNNLRTVEPK